MHRHVALLLTASAMLGAVPATAQIVPPKIYSTTPTGVNLADSAFTYSTTDIAIGPLKLERFYIGSYLNDPNAMFFGRHTSTNFDIYVTRRVKSVGRYVYNVYLGASQGGMYDVGSPNPIESNLDSRRGTLEIVSGNLVYTDAAGTIYAFTASVPVLSVGGGVMPSSQRIASITYPDGRVQSFSYNASRQLKLVSDTSGYAMVFDYGANGSISAACGFNLSRTYVTASSTCSGAALKTSYGYSGDKLTGFTDVMNQTTTYGWSDSITCIKPPGYANCKITNIYLYTNKIDRQILADGSVWTYASNAEPGVIPDEGQAIETDGQINGGVMDPDGKSFGGTFTRSSPYSFTDANGQTTQYRYTGASDFFSNNPPGGPLAEGSFLVEVTYPEGNKYLAEYNGAYRALSKETLVAKPGSGLPDLVKGYLFGVASYPVTRQNVAKPNGIVDPNGNRTDFTYAPHGGVTSEMQPAPVAGAARPLKLYTYVQGYAYVKNSGGALVAAASPVWLPATETLCQTYAGSSTASCDPAAPITVTSYEYGASGTADNLLLRGLVVTSAGVSLRTCYGYDEYGNKIFETKPRAGLASCS